MKSIFICTNYLAIDEVYSNHSKSILEYKAGLNINHVYTREEIIHDKSGFLDVECIFSTWDMPLFTEDEIDKYFPNLKSIFYAAGSVKYFAYPYLKRGVKIYSSKHANAIPVAEFVTSQIILANKGYFQSQLKYRRSFYTCGFRIARNIAKLKPGNYKSLVGIIGAGSVGKKVISLLNNYDLDILVYDPYISDDVLDSMNCKRGTLEEIFNSCDVITNHLPDNENTKNMLNYHLFSLMKENATLINTGRGNQIVEKDLLKVLKIKKSMCILLDVTKREPLFPFNILKYKRNVFLSPHISGSLGFEQYRMSEIVLEAFDDYTNSNISIHEIKLNDISISA